MTNAIYLFNDAMANLAMPKCRTDVDLDGGGNIRRTFLTHTHTFRLIGSALFAMFAMHDEGH